ncbi:MAG: hypothetical protein Q4G50_13030 [Corynebacterium sp.]|uniref:hypothetical protein n=1 Tax=Corynebacterium sp. TaxID=1720 RepID=UPI0026E09A48|nr:hypothetical protein [Corynebacterium sp.]MDO5670907.1 hypothetical protein [Corynebacterium sp.]
MLILALLTIAPVGFLLWRRRGQPEAPKHLVLTYLGGILVWLATMSWPLGPHGDYQPWQVILAGAAMVALTIAFALRLPGAGAAIGWSAASGFALAWGVWAGLQDETGLWGVGLIMVLLGAGTSLALVGWLTGVIGRRRTP